VARTRFPGLQLLRSAFLMCSTTLFFFGISHIGLAQATAIMDVNPVLITLGAALFLGETVGPRRIVAIAISLVGAMIVIRPGGAVFSLWSLLPFCAAFTYAGYALMTRYVGRSEDPWTSLLYGALFGAIILTVLVPFHWQPVTPKGVVLMLMLAGFGTLGQLLLIRAFTAGEAAVLAPFGYVGLVFATLFGIVAFGEWPDLWTWVGALVIVGSGLYVWHREHGARTAP
jgi:drug/metabolite transporter (DMT)-like permease